MKQWGQLDCSVNEFVALEEIHVGSVWVPGCRVSELKPSNNWIISDKRFHEFLDKVSSAPTSNTTIRYTFVDDLRYIVFTYHCFRNIKDMCTGFDLSGSFLSIWSEGYGHGISNSTHSDCNCSISAAAPLVHITYYTNLTPQQKLTLAYANGSVLTEWKHNNFVKPSTRNTHAVGTLKLTWHNGDVPGHGTFWIAFEGNITLRCYEAFTVASTAFTTTATSMYSTTAKTISTTTANRTATTAFVDTTLTLAVTSPIATPIEQTDATSSTNATVESPTPKSDQIWIIIGVCIAAVLLLILVVVGIVYFVSAKNRNQKVSSEDEQKPTSYNDKNQQDINGTITDRPNGELTPKPDHHTGSLPPIVHERINPDPNLGSRNEQEPDSENVAIEQDVDANLNNKIHLKDEQNPTPSTSNVERRPLVFSEQPYPHAIPGRIYEQEHDLTERKHKRKRNKKKKKRKDREDAAEIDELYSTIGENGGVTTE